MNKKPLIIFDDHYRKGRAGQESLGKQNLLLRGILLTGGNMEKAAKLSGLRNAAEAYRMMDRISIRKGYHEALEAEGINLQWIVRGIKDKAENAQLDSVRLAALRMLLTSLGLNTYNVQEEGAKNWEDTLLEMSEKSDASDGQKSLSSGYDVVIPEMPESVRAQREEENEIGKELYAGK